MKRTSLLSFAAALLFASSLSAQTVTFQGKVENGEGACYYCPGFDWVIDIADVPITSSVYNLDNFIGLYVDAVGQWNGSLQTPIIDITSMSVVPQSFSIGGGAKVGGVMKFSVWAGAGDFGFVIGSVGTGFQPLGRSKSLYLLDLSSSHVVASGVLDSTGLLKVKVPLNDPALGGLQVFGQGMVLPQGGGGFYFTNPDTKVIAP
ncbi:MAG TPA: hypothetical protein ENJ09_07930 [Planctomycetes bacterium]|nr:hypothetical protein [Planctomycetota bacterium]